MADVENVIYAIERCTCHVPDACRDCPYDAGHPYNECIEMLLKDALELLKEQEDLDETPSLDAKARTAEGGKAGMRLIDADALMEYCNNLKGKMIDANDIARFPTAVSWGSVKDRLPEESEDVLIYNGHCDVLGFSKRWQKFNTYDVLDDANNAIDVTHWQRLPEPPKEEHDDS